MLVKLILLPAQKILALSQGRATAEKKNLNVLSILKALSNKDMNCYGKMHPPTERLGNKHSFFQDKQDPEQPAAVHAFSFGKNMKIDGGSSESDIPGLFQQSKIRDIARKSELLKGFWF